MFIRGSSSRNRVFFATMVMVEIFAMASGNRLMKDRPIWSKKGEWTELSELRERRRMENAWDGSVGNTGVDVTDDANIFGNRYGRDGDSKVRLESSVVPPPVDEVALMGRFIVNQADWAAVATISTREDIPSFPTANVISVSDGPLGNGSGVPYMYLTPLDYTAKDLAVDHRATLLMTLAQGSYCKDKQMDPMDPRCARILLSGKIKKVEPNSPELEIAKKVIFGRHPKLAGMPADHKFFFAKLEIAAIAILDTFGGPKYVTPDDYFNPPTAEDRQFDSRSYDDLRYAFRI